ncbi:MAG: hypothetical protein ACRDNG_03960 [Gaiellaceae bacterium]
MSRAVGDHVCRERPACDLVEDERYRCFDVRIEADRGRVDDEIGARRHPEAAPGRLDGDLGDEALQQRAELAAAFGASVDHRDARGAGEGELDPDRPGGASCVQEHDPGSIRVQPAP